ncbi:hypothetical protein ES703_21453 [subsurface metagenome]
MSSSFNDFGAFKKILGPKRGSKRTSSNPIKKFHEFNANYLKFRLIIELYKFFVINIFLKIII